MVEGPSVDRHHLIPKAKGGRHGDQELCHVICHRKIHSALTEGELSSHYNTWERLREHPHIQSFIKWVSKKPADYIDKHRDTLDRKKRRRNR